MAAGFETTDEVIQELLLLNRLPERYHVYRFAHFIRERLFR